MYVAHRGERFLRQFRFQTPLGKYLAECLFESLHDGSLLEPSGSFHFGIESRDYSVSSVGSPASMAELSK
ncbi:MAG: hypothetical protein AMXMBFR59_26240 [Rhodanobacteraceae bacterium]